MSLRKGLIDYTGHIVFYILFKDTLVYKGKGKKECPADFLTEEEAEKYIAHLRKHLFQKEIMTEREDYVIFSTDVNLRYSQ